jgi:nucleoside triphosphate diphosphatase
MNSDSRSPCSFDRALALVTFLRAGCEWDARQTPESLVPYLLEEAAEVADAVLDGARAELPGELGDLLLNIAFQTIIAEERSTFTREDVVRGLESKMRRRHPQLYGDGPAASWAEHKAREQAAAAIHAADKPAAPSILAGVPRALDPLSRAQRIQERVSNVGFDWADTSGAYGKVREEIEEVGDALAATDAAHLEEELGDLLFAVVNLTRLAGVNAHRALQQANAKFSRRFTRLEALAADRGVTLGQASLEQLDEVWDAVKAEERA